MSNCCTTCGFDECKCGCDGFTVLRGPEIEHTLIASLTPCVDQIRDIATCLGARPYRVSLVWTRWTGGERGAGQEEIVREEMILPTPVVKDLSGLRNRLTPIGLDEVGDLQVSQISPRYTEDLLMGRVSDDGHPISEDESFFYEVFAPGHDHTGIRRRFFPVSAPTYEPTKFEWKVNLRRASEDRSRCGDLQ